MKKKLVTREQIENIPELEHLPEGKVLLLGPEMEESDLKAFFHETDREIVMDDSTSVLEKNCSAYG